MDQIVFFMNGDRGLAVLRKIINRGHHISDCVLPENSSYHEKVAESTQHCDTAIHLEKNVNAPEFHDALRLRQCRLGIVAGFSTIFGADLIALPELGTINLHAGIVPNYRGGSPLNWQIINGEKEGGVSVLRMDAGIDTGPILAEGRFPITQEDTIREAHERANSLFSVLVCDVLEHFDNGTISPTAQDESKAHYWHQRNDEDGRLVFDCLTARQALNLIRAVTRPYPGAHARLGEHRVRIFSARMPTDSVCGVPGRVLHLQGRGPLVICKAGTIEITDYEIESQPSLPLKTGDMLR